RTDDLLPPYPIDGLTILSERDMPWLARGAREPKKASASSASSAVESSWLNAFASTVVPGAGDALGSNNWVVDGTMTASGKPVQIVKESIKVKGAAAIPLDVRITRHGPLISDAINANNAESPRLPRVAPLEPLAFRWTALDPEDGTIAAFLRLNEARNWTEFT